jgi:hypothetical protein
MEQLVASRITYRMTTDSREQQTTLDIENHASLMFDDKFIYIYEMVDDCSTLTHVIKPVSFKAIIQ